MKPAQDDQVQANQATQAIQANQADDVPTPTLSEEISAEFGGKEREPIKIGEEILTQIEQEKHKELIDQGYIERVERQAELATSVIDPTSQQILVQSSAPQKPKIKLPLSEGQIEEGLHHKIWESIRWLAEWCKRQLEILYTKS